MSKKFGAAFRIAAKSAVLFGHYRRWSKSNLSLAKMFEHPSARSPCNSHSCSATAILITLTC
jgi:hypothetical protein